MQKFHQLRQIFLGEVIGAQTSIETRQAEKNCIGSVRHGRARAVPISGRR
jgi:hypothetical protein